MLYLFQEFDLKPIDWILFSLCAIFIGLSKAGVSGAGLMVVPLMAKVFGARESVGILLPMLIFADVYAVKYYNRHAQWKHIFRLLPWALLGILVGLFFGKSINDDQFKQTIAVIVLLGIALMIWFDIRKDKILVPESWWFAAILGLAGGFTLW